MNIISYPSLSKPASDTIILQADDKQGICAAEILSINNERIRLI